MQPIPERQDSQDGRWQVLVVRGRKAADPPPVVHGVSGLEAQIARLWKDIGNTCGWKHPGAPSAKRLWGEKPTEAVLAFLRGTRVEYISTRRKLPPARGGGGGHGRRGGWAGPALDCILSSFLC